MILTSDHTRLKDIIELMTSLKIAGTTIDLDPTGLQTVGDAGQIWVNFDADLDLST